MTRRRTLVLIGVAAVLAVAVVVTSCQVYTKASFDMPVGAGYSVRTYHIRTPLRIAGETVRDMGPHPSAASPPGVDHGYETWLVQAERRVGPRPLLRVVRVGDRTLEVEVPRLAYVFWEEPGVVRLIERDPPGTVTFLHEVRPEPAFLASG